MKIAEQLNNILHNQPHKLKEWFANQYQDLAPCLYNSVDIRHSGNKIVPVDTNIFPAGFNNLNRCGKNSASQQASDFLGRYFPNTKNILIIPETFTRNLYYLDNLASLKEILEKAGYSVTLGDLRQEPEDQGQLISQSGIAINLVGLEARNQQLQTTDNWVPDLIILNNDLTDGVPPILKNITQSIIPSINLGWHIRRKSSHFTAYDHIARNFSSEFDIDPFLITTLFHTCGEIDFKERSGIECVAMGVEKLLHNLRDKYKTHGITDQPYVFIKSNKGTYGMGIMTVTSGDEVYEMNKKLRNQMGVIKSGIVNDDVIIQEGVKTIDLVNNVIAEQMLYLISGMPVGRIYRINGMKDEFGNLNTKGMSFAMNLCDDNTSMEKYDASGLIARLASLAAAKESY